MAIKSSDDVRNLKLAARSIAVVAVAAVVAVGLLAWPIAVAIHRLGGAWGPALQAASAVVLILVTALYVIFTARLVTTGEETIRRDHDRRQKQATLDAFGRAQIDNRDGTRALRAEFKMKNLTLEQVRLLRGETEPSPPTGTKDEDQDAWVLAEKARQEDLRNHLRTYLNELERIAVGARLGIYSVEVLEEQAKTVLTRARARYAVYIERVRESEDPITGKRGEMAYIALDWLCYQFKPTETGEEPSAALAPP